MLRHPDLLPTAWHLAEPLSLSAGSSRAPGSGAGNAFNPRLISVARVRLLTAAEAGQTEAAPGEIYAVIHPFHYHDTLVSAANLGSNINSDSGYAPIQGLTEQIIREYDIKMLYNVPIVQHALMEIDSSDDAVGAVFSKEAFLFIKTSNMMKNETERDPSLRAYSTWMTSEYGVGEIADQWCFKIVADATAPTSYEGLRCSNAPSTARRPLPSIRAVRSRSPSTTTRPRE